MRFIIKLADQFIEINSLYEKVYHFCEQYIVDKPHDLYPVISVTISESDIEYERIGTLNRQKKANERVRIDFAPQHLEIFATYRKIVESMPDYNTFLIHGSVISTNGIGYMLTAASGVGKTTRTKLWCSYINNSFVVNGDKPLLKINNNMVYAYGTPWCGKESLNTNISVPLQAIIFLERAHSEEDNIIKEIPFSEAFSFLLHQTYFSRDSGSMHKELSLLMQLDGKVKFYIFRSTPTSNSVRLAYETVKKKY